MNKEYAYVDGKVIVSDETGKLIQRDYRENIDKILVQENVVEKIEKDIKELEEEVDKFNKEKIIKFPAFTLLFLLFSAYMAYAPLIDGVSINLFNIIIITAFEIPVICVGLLLDKVLIFDPFKKNKGNVSKLEYLKVALQNDKKILSDMQKYVELKEDKKEVAGVKVVDKKVITALDSEENLYYDVGANLKKYYLLYQKGKLADKLAKYYNQKGVEIATEYVKENGPKLVRKN